ncbi:hypothetical protein KKH27_10070, partial [bacterium]|nr:hypothetical protein [bacterium]
LARRFREDFNHTAANDFDRGTFEMRRLSAPNQSWIGQRLWKFITNDFPEKSKWYTRRERFGKTWAGRAVLSILKTVMLGLKRYCSLVAVYRYVTLYGGSILLPAVWTLTMTAGFAGLYELTAYGGVLPAASWSWPTHGTIAALRVIALNRAWLATEIADKPYELQVTAIASLQVILTAVLVTMLIFAVRRRFKHG